MRERVVEETVAGEMLDSLEAVRRLLSPLLWNLGADGLLMLFTSKGHRVLS